MNRTVPPTLTSIPTAARNHDVYQGPTALWVTYLAEDHIFTGFDGVMATVSVWMVPGTNVE